MTEEIQPVGFVSISSKRQFEWGSSQMILPRTNLAGNKGSEDIAVVPASGVSELLYVVWPGCDKQPVVQAGGVIPLHETFKTN